MRSNKPVTFVRIVLISTCSTEGTTIAIPKAAIAMAMRIAIELTYPAIAIAAVVVPTIAAIRQFV